MSGAQATRLITLTLSMSTRRFGTERTKIREAGLGGRYWKIFGLKFKFLKLLVSTHSKPQEVLPPRAVIANFCLDRRGCTGRRVS